MTIAKIALVSLIINIALFDFGLNAHAEILHLVCHTHRVKPRVGGDVIQEFDADAERQELSWTTQGMSGINKNKEERGSIISTKTEVNISSRLIKVDNWHSTVVYTNHSTMIIDRASGAYSTFEEYIVYRPQEYKGPTEGVEESGTCEKRDQSNKF